MKSYFQKSFATPPPTTILSSIKLYFPKTNTETKSIVTCLWGNVCSTRETTLNKKALISYNLWTISQLLYRDNLKYMQSWELYLLGWVLMFLKPRLRPGHPICTTRSTVKIQLKALSSQSPISATCQASPSIDTLMSSHTLFEFIFLWW